MVRRTQSRGLGGSRVYKWPSGAGKTEIPVKSETQRRSAWQTLLDRLGTACFAVMLWTLVQYLFGRFR